METNKKILFTHGYTASSEKDWYPNISEELDEMGIDYSIPDLPGGKHPHSRDWLEIIHEEVELTSKPIILVGHSLGTRAALLYLDKYEKKIDTVILIAAFDNDYEKNRKRKNGNYADFFEYSIDLDKVKNLANQFIVMHSKDDSSIDYEQGVTICKKLDGKLKTYEDRDHFSEPENAEYVLETLQSVL